MYRLPNTLINTLRIVIALVWLHEGLWMKLIHPDPHERSIVQAVGAPLSLSPSLFLGLIGGGETLIALGVLSGLFSRPLAIFQIVVLLTMNLIAIFFGQGTIADPIGLLIHNLPLIVCIALVGWNSKETQPTK